MHCSALLPLQHEFAVLNAEGFDELGDLHAVAHLSRAQETVRYIFLAMAFCEFCRLLNHLAERGTGKPRFSGETPALAPLATLI